MAELIAKSGAAETHGQAACAKKQLGPFAATQPGLTPALALCHAKAAACESRFGRISGLLSSCRGLWAALKLLSRPR